MSDEISLNSRVQSDCRLASSGSLISPDRSTHRTCKVHLCCWETVCVCALVSVCLQKSWGFKYLRGSWSDRWTDFTIGQILGVQQVDECSMCIHWLTRCTWHKPMFNRAFKYKFDNNNFWLYGVYAICMCEQICLPRCFYISVQTNTGILQQQSSHLLPVNSDGVNIYQNSSVSPHPQILSSCRSEIYRLKTKKQNSDLSVGCPCTFLMHASKYFKQITF